MAWDFDDDDLPDDEAEELSPEQVAALSERIKERIFEPKEYNLKPSKKRIAVVDTETDPFDYGLHVKPFCLGFHTDDRYVDFWGDNCVSDFFDYLRTLDDDFIIYAHNGGKFDFYFFLDYLDPDQTPLIMGGRLVTVKFAGQEFRDSYAIIPQALSSYQKDEIDYDKFKRNVRQKHKAEILKYMKADCAYTYDLIRGFHDMFGDKLTIASAALPMLQSFHGFAKIGGDQFDDRFRQYFYGGRNQCFETGVLRGNWKVYDRNSMYPAVMRDCLHPIGNEYTLQSEIDDDTDFACIVARNRGALPTRGEDDSLDFTVKHGTFYATIHEIRAGIETGTLEIERVKHAWKCNRKTSFANFVNHFYGLRMQAKDAEDKVRDILYKLVLNSAYGKFALNPRKFKQWLMTTHGDMPEPLATEEKPEGWTLHSQSGDIFIWSRPSPRKGGFYNVATAASITGAARANLLRNLALAKRPIYCDTDSIICESFRGELDNKALGGWKLEAEGDRAAIAGKKLYAVFNEKEVLKKASKGVNISALDIVDVCNGKEIVYQNPVPNFKLDGTADFVTRRVNMTGTV
jgi:DNA polymerase elongation subunit (family B)